MNELLAASLGLSVSGRYADDCREFCGLWTAEEMAEFDVNQAGNRRVDEDDWK